ncbi:hypothetical protein J2T55_002033 [Methylohalomonas lacus]|uniref:Uncharacterized protein n=1 Tax=Methylohalomonas lacus TaxID=398773 RepID=A0AAE3L259_9GAMM|nr:hypothetical protein [Methylohalomonas lacus]MCS3904001.1 hypothetical protein [Methylohalomonas lacus]
MPDWLFYTLYGGALGVLILHFTGWLERHDMPWLMYVAVLCVFSAVAGEAIL